MKEQTSELGKIIGFIGFFAGLIFGWNISQNLLVALIIGVIFGAVGATVGNVITKILVVVLSIALAFVSIGGRIILSNLLRGAVSNSQQSQTYKPYNTHIPTPTTPTKSYQTETELNSNCRLYNDKPEHSNVYIRSQCDIYDCDKDASRILEALPDNTAIKMIDEDDSIPSKVRPYSWVKVEIVSTGQIVWVADSKIKCGS